jgi:hypothetical protein
MEATLYRVLWGALGDAEKTAILDVANTEAEHPSQELVDSIREAEQCLDIGGLPVSEVLVTSPDGAASLDAEFLEWVRSRSA